MELNKVEISMSCPSRKLREFMWTCKQCGTENEDQFDSCWSCTEYSGRELPLETENLDADSSIEREKSWVDFIFAGPSDPAFYETTISSKYLTTQDWLVLVWAVLWRFLLIALIWPVKFRSGPGIISRYFSLFALGFWIVIAWLSHSPYGRVRFKIRLPRDTQSTFVMYFKEGSYLAAPVFLTFISFGLVFGRRLPYVVPVATLVALASSLRRLPGRSEKMWKEGKPHLGIIFRDPSDGVVKFVVE